MYQIIVNGKPIGYAQKPNYVQKLDNGSWGLCTSIEAEGVAFDGTVYPMDNIALAYQDSGVYAQMADEQAKAFADTDELMVDQEYRLTLLELGLTE